MNHTSPTGTVTNPKLTLYAFHLRNNLALGSQQPVDSADFLWQKFQEIGQKLNIPRLESFPSQLRDENSQTSDYLELLPEDRLLHFSAIPQAGKLQLRGELYPVQIHDAYAADLTLRYPYPAVEIPQLSGLNPDGCLLPSHIQASLGQTLVLFAQPPDKIQDCQKFAGACVAALRPDSEAKKLLLSCQAKGQFLGSPIFEYNSNEDNSHRQCHILVWLNGHRHTEELEAKGEYYHPLLNLLCCRSKILYVRFQAGLCNDRLRSLYTQLESQVKDFNQLKVEYHRHLRDLELHRQTIQTNAKNYRFWIDKITPLCIQGDNLEFLQDFLNLANNQFQEQIRVDLAYLSAGEKFFQQAHTTSTRKVEKDRLVRLTLGDGDFQLGFPVTADIWTGSHLLPIQVTGKLPPSTEIPQIYSRWKEFYKEVFDVGRELKPHKNKITNFSSRDKYKLAELGKELKENLNAWLNSPEFRPIADKMREIYNPADSFRVIVQTSTDELRRLPWHLWDFFTDYRQAEIALSNPAANRVTKSAPPRNQVRILAILGNSEGIDVSADRLVLENLSGAETKFLVEPTRQELDPWLWHQQGWDILCFSGHSSSKEDGSTGSISLNKTDKLAMTDLENALRKAIERGLQLAIFNSCDGLGLARDLADLHIPQIIVMREPVPNKVAQEFLKNFLTAFAGGQSLYISVREAREKLQSLEAEFPCATWLPVICQNPAELPVTWKELG
jgi:hypothetical protein